jgi:hypothetical protein
MMNKVFEDDVAFELVFGVVVAFFFSGPDGPGLGIVEDDVVLLSDPR